MIVFYFSKRDLHFFEAARQESHKADFRVQVGAVLTFQSRIIATGYSSEKTSPVQMRYNAYRKFEDTNQTQHKLHAEVMALLKVRHMDIDFSRCSMYIWREYSDGSPALARPCEACMAMLRQYGVKHIYYSGDGSRVYEHVA